MKFTKVFYSQSLLEVFILTISIFFPFSTIYALDNKGNTYKSPDSVVVGTKWISSYDGPLHAVDKATDLVVDSTGNVYVTGYSQGLTSGNDILTIKYLPNGDTAWTNRYNGIDLDDEPYAMALDNSGNIFVSGFTTGTNSKDYITLKINPDGSTAWDEIYNGTGNGIDEAFDIAIDTYGYVYVTGRSDDIDAGYDYDYVTIKYSNSGSQVWLRRYKGSAGKNDIAQDIEIDNANNCFYVTGYSDGGSSGYDITTIKYTNGGTELWAKRYTSPGAGFDRGRKVAIDTAGNVFVMGNLYSDYSVKDDFITIKYLPDGDSSWINIYNGPSDSTDIAHDVDVDEYGNTYITGRSYQGTSDYDIVTIKYYPDGAQAWMKTYNGSADGVDEGTSILVDRYDYIYVTGTIENNDSYLDYIIIKYDSLGNEIWTNNYSGSGALTDETSAITIDYSNTVYVTGASNSSSSGWDYLTAGYTQYYCFDEDEDGFGDPGHPENDCLADNCPEIFNPLQEDIDSDGIGDSCDNCITAYNPNQWDVDSDTKGDSCDNCPLVANSLQEDVDSDLYGDSCDNCVLSYNPDQEDIDIDLVGDSCDNCISVFNPSQSDYDLDGLGNLCDDSSGAEFIIVYDTIGDNDGYGYGHLTVPDGANLPYTDDPHSGSGWNFDNRTQDEIDATDGSQQTDIEPMSSITFYHSIDTSQFLEITEAWFTIDNSGLQNFDLFTLLYFDGEEVIDFRSIPDQGAWGSGVFHYAVDPTTLTDGELEVIVDLASGDGIAIDFTSLSVVGITKFDHDVTVSQIIAPVDSIALDSTVIPEVIVKNVGNYVESFDVVFEFGSNYIDTLSVVSLSPNDSTTVYFADWTADFGGSYIPKCYTLLGEDQYNDNDTAVGFFNVPVVGPTIYSITPDSGGNTGIINTTINGDGIQEGAVVRLFNGIDSIYVTKINYISDSTIEIVIDLSNYEIGSYDIIVINPDNGIGTLFNGFNIVDGISNFWINIVGRDQIRFNRQQTYNIYFGNNGNTDAENVSLLLKVPQNIKIEIKYDGYTEPFIYDPTVNPPVDDSEKVIVEQSIGDVKINESDNIQCAITIISPTMDSLEIEIWGSQHSIFFDGRIDSLPHDKHKLLNYSSMEIKKTNSGREIKVIIWEEFGYKWTTNSFYPIIRLRRHPIIVDEDNRIYYDVATDAKTKKRFLSALSEQDYNIWKAGIENIYVQNGERIEDGYRYIANMFYDNGLSLYINNYSEFISKLNSHVNTYFNETVDCMTGLDKILEEVGDDWIDESLDPAYYGDQLIYELKCGADNCDPNNFLTGKHSDYQPGNTKINDDEGMDDNIDPVKKETKKVEKTEAIDPNDKIGPSGIGSGNFLKGIQPFHYTIYFENVDTATAEAIDIFITDTLSEYVDWNTFEFGEIYPGDGPDSIRPDYTYDVDFNDATGVITWNLYNINLPPDTIPYWGEGYVSYSIWPQDGLPTGTHIENIAAIKFDYNDWILTPMDSIPVFNTIDAGKPSSNINALPDTSGTVQIDLSWTGADDPDGSGISTYSIYVSIDEGPYVPWIQYISDTSATFTGEHEHTYAFYSIATDSVGFVEDAPETYDAKTTISCCVDLTGNANCSEIDEPDISDIVRIIDFLYLSHEPLCCPPETDCNGSGGPDPDISDIVCLIDWLYLTHTTPSPCP